MIPPSHVRVPSGRSARRLAVLLALVVGATGALVAAAPAPPVAAADGVVAAADGGTIATTLVPPANAFPTGSGPQRHVSRDCGHSVEVPGGRSLWLFCDTAIYDQVTGPGPAFRAGRIGFVPSGTAGLGAIVTDPSPSRPVRITEADHPALPQAFIVSGNTYGPNRATIPCNGSLKAFAWTQGLVTLPGTSTVVAFYQDHCPDLASGFAPYDVGVAELTLPEVPDGDVSAGRSLKVERQYDSVQVNPTPGRPMQSAYAEGAVVEGPYLYLYGSRPTEYDCSGNACRIVRPGGVELARVTWADGGYRTASKYRYYTGRGSDPWSANEADAANILPDLSTPAGDGISVAWQPELGRYVMIHADTGLGTSIGPDVRTSLTPWGPWSATVQVAPSAASAYGAPGAGCGAPASCRTYRLHPELSGGSRLWFSYVREGDLATADGRPATIETDKGMTVRLASVPFTALPAAPAPDGTALPGRPTAVTATAGDGRATVSWTAPPPVAGSPVVGYRVTPRLGGQALDPVAVSGTATSVTVPGLENTRSYTFTVAAVTAAGVGPASTASAAVTPRGAPRAPTAVTATAGDGAATVSWSAPTNTGGAAITGYRVTPYVDGVAQAPRVLTQTATSKVIGSLANGTTYTFSVQAVTSLGTSGPSAPSAPVTPYGVPGAPTQVAATPQDGQVALTWRAPATDGGSPVTGYRVTPYVGGTAQPVRVLTTTTPSTTVTGLQNGTAYTFTVAAVNARGVGAPSAATAAVTPRTAAGAPTAVTATPGDGRATVAWKAPANTGGLPITGYRVTTFQGGAVLSSKDFTSTATSQTITGLVNGTSYAFVVRAITAVGPGASSDFSPVVTPRTTPGAPTGITVTPGNGLVTVSFTAPSNNGGAPVTGYRITPYVGSTAQPARTVSFATTHIFDGLANGTTYTFAVQAVNAAGAGASASSPPATPRTLPGAPAGVRAAAGNGSATVSWTAPTANGGAAVTGYQVTPWVGSTALAPRVFASPATSQVVTGLANGTVYRFSVRAVNAAGAGTSSGFSDPVTPTASGAPSAPAHAPYGSWAAMVDGLFRAILDRAPTASERSTWVGRLSGGTTTPGGLAASLRTAGDQATVLDPVARLYRAYFLRPPDAGGLTYWVGQRRSGRSLSWVSEQFAKSREFTVMYGALSDEGFMDLVYRQVLERAPDASGRAYWVGELRSGRRTRGSVMIGFSEAAEYKARYGATIEAAVAHLRLLGRAPSAAEASAWVTSVAGGATTASRYDALIASAEYAVRVNG